jgi:uncharacterized membrane protein YjjP (DUF1212 family)
MHVLAHMVSAAPPGSSSAESISSVSIEGSRVAAATALSYFALYLPGLWDPFIVSPSSSLLAVKDQFIRALAHLLASFPCQVCGCFCSCACLESLKNVSQGAILLLAASSSFKR